MEFNAAVQTILKNTPMHEANPEHDIVVVTDAATETNLGAGVVVTRNGHILVHTFRITKYNSINDMEAQALYQTLRHFEEKLSHHRINYFGDNTSVLFTLKSGVSKSFDLNLWTGRILSRLHIMGSTLASLYYVPSNFIPADAPSRNMPFTEEHLSVLTSLSNCLQQSVGVE